MIFTTFKVKMSYIRHFLRNMYKFKRNNADTQNITYVYNFI